MKVVVTSQGTTPDSLVESHFGRGKYFLIFDSELSQWEPMTLLNTAAEANEEAGTEAARTVVETGAKAVIANHCGPKAFDALEKGGVKIYPAGGRTAIEAVKALDAGELQAFARPDLCSLSMRPKNGSA